MSTIRVRARHLTGTAALDEVRRSYGKGVEVSSAAAVTIASWWQSSGSVGRVLAAFASGAHVDRDELLDDIAATRRVEGYGTQQMSSDDCIALDMLSTFVINYQD